MSLCKDTRPLVSTRAGRILVCGLEVTRSFEHSSTAHSNGTNKVIDTACTSCYALPCIPNLILAEVPPVRPSVLLPFPLTPSPELQLLYNPQFRKTGL